MNLQGLSKADIARKIYIREMTDVVDDAEKLEEIIKEIEEMDDDEITDSVVEYYASAGFTDITIDYIVGKFMEEPMEFTPFIVENTNADIARIVYRREFEKLLEQGIDVKSDLKLLPTMTDDEVIKAVVELFECLGFENVTIEGIVFDYNKELESLNF
jgi:DUF1009 family protein